MYIRDIYHYFAPTWGPTFYIECASRKTHLEEGE